MGLIYIMYHTAGCKRTVGWSQTVKKSGHGFHFKSKSHPIWKRKSFFFSLNNKEDGLVDAIRDQRETTPADATTTTPWRLADWIFFRRTDGWPGLGFQFMKPLSISRQTMAHERELVGQNEKLLLLLPRLLPRTPCMLIMSAE